MRIRNSAKKASAVPQRADELKVRRNGSGSAPSAQTMRVAVLSAKSELAISRRPRSSARTRASTGARYANARGRTTGSEARLEFGSRRSARRSASAAYGNVSVANTITAPPPSGAGNLVAAASSTMQSAAGSSSPKAVKFTSDTEPSGPTTVVNRAVAARAPRNLYAQ